MMRFILIISLLLGVVEAEELTTAQVAKARNYNHSLSGKLRYKRLLQNMAKINKQEAREIVKEKIENQKILYLKLLRRGARLFYLINTKSSTVRVDALDGSIMDKQ